MVVLSLCEIPALMLTVRAKNRVVPFLPVCFEALGDVVVGVFWLGVMGNHGVIVSIALLPGVIFLKKAGVDMPASWGE